MLARELISRSLFATFVPGPGPALRPITAPPLHLPREAITREDQLNGSVVHRAEPSESVEFSLLENGLDFIQSGCQYIARGESKSDLKYGVLHLASGIELVLKARLAAQSWKLLFKDLKKASLHSFRAGKFEGVTMWKCLKRLESQCGIKLSDGQRRSLEVFREKRNQLEHFRIIDTKAALEASAVAPLSVTLDFIRDEFDDEDLSNEELRLIRKIRGLLSQFTTFRNSKLRQIRRMLRRKPPYARVLIPVPHARRKHFRRMSKSSVCSVATGQRRKKPRIYSSRGLEGFQKTKLFGKVTATSAASVQVATIARLLTCCMPTRGPHYICFACGMTWQTGQLDLCGDCGQMKPANEIFANRCLECTKSYLERD